MGIRFYNSLSRSKEEFHSLEPGSVSLYTCGPTVHNYQHIGNLRAYIVWDVLKRFLQSQGYAVTHIMNVTDVGHLTDDADAGEDKLELAKKRDHMTAWDVARKYFEIFQQDIALVNISPPTAYVKATETIPEQIEFVKKLELGGYLYRTTDGLYFDTSKIADYGLLGRLDAKGLKAGARVAPNPEKKNLTDFAVWKFSPTDRTRDMEWDSPWGKGFPGWHLECSAISMKYLGETFDIHTGGVDHLTVHHPNEMAQSRAVSGKQQARYWLHNNFVQYQRQKMAKSAGTFIRLEDVAVGGIAPLGYRFYILQTHYRKEIQYSWDALKAAYAGLKNIYKDMSFYNAPNIGCADYEERFYQALADDLNTAKALDVLQQLMKSSYPSSAKLQTLFVMDEILCLNMRTEWERRRTIPQQAHPLLKERKQARDRRDWKAADRLRVKMLEMGVEVQDTQEGQLAALSE